MTTKNPKFLKIPLAEKTPTLGGFFSTDWFPLNIIIIGALAGIGVLIWWLVKPKKKKTCKSGEIPCPDSSGTLITCCPKDGKGCCNGKCELEDDERCINNKTCPVNQSSYDKDGSPTELDVCCDKGDMILPNPGSATGCKSCNTGAVCKSTDGHSKKCQIEQTGSRSPTPWGSQNPLPTGVCNTDKDCNYTICPIADGSPACCITSQCTGVKCCESTNLCKSTDGNLVTCCDNGQTCCQNGTSQPTCCEHDDLITECCGKNSKGEAECQMRCIDDNSLQPNSQTPNMAIKCNPSWKPCPKDPPTVCTEDQGVTTCAPIGSCGIKPGYGPIKGGALQPYKMGTSMPQSAPLPGKDILPLYSCSVDSAAGGVGCPLDNHDAQNPDPTTYLYGAGYKAGSVGRARNNLPTGGTNWVQYIEAKIADAGPACTGTNCYKHNSNDSNAQGNCCDCSSVKFCEDVLDWGMDTDSWFQEEVAAKIKPSCVHNTNFPGGESSTYACLPGTPGPDGASQNQISACLATNNKYVAENSPSPGALPCEISQACKSVAKPCCDPSKQRCRAGATDNEPPCETGGSATEPNKYGIPTALDFTTAMTLPPIFVPSGEKAQTDKHALYPHQACSSWTSAPSDPIGGGYVTYAKGSQHPEWNGLVCVDGGSSAVDFMGNLFCGYQEEGELPGCFYGFTTDGNCTSDGFPRKAVDKSSVLPVNSPQNYLGELDPVQKAYDSAKAGCNTPAPNYYTPHYYCNQISTPGTKYHGTDLTRTVLECNPGSQPIYVGTAVPARTIPPCPTKYPKAIYTHLPTAIDNCQCGTSGEHGDGMSCGNQGQGKARADQWCRTCCVGGSGDDLGDDDNCHDDCDTGAACGYQCGSCSAWDGCDDDFCYPDANAQCPRLCLNAGRDYHRPFCAAYGCANAGKPWPADGENTGERGNERGPASIMMKYTEIVPTEAGKGETCKDNTDCNYKNTKFHDAYCMGGGGRPASVNDSYGGKCVRLSELTTCTGTASAPGPGAHPCVDHEDMIKGNHLAYQCACAPEDGQYSGNAE